MSSVFQAEGACKEERKRRKKKKEEEGKGRKRKTKTAAAAASVVSRLFFLFRVGPWICVSIICARKLSTTTAV